MNEKATATDHFLRPDHLIRDEVKILCDTLRKFVNEKVLPHEDKFDALWDWTERKEPTIVEQIFKELWIDLGLQAAQVPPPYGGYGDWSTVETGAIVIEVARGDHGLAETGFISSWAVASTTLPAPNDTVMKQIADGMLGKEPFAICSAITEPQGGGGVEDMKLKGAQTKTKARLVKDEWVINGEKLWPSAYREAKAFVVVCAIEGKEFPDNIAQIYVPADTPGVTTGKPYQKMGTAIDTNGEIWFEDVRVPKEYLLHEGEDEVKSLLAKCTIGRAFASAFSIGMMRRAYEIFKLYVDNREIAGVPMKDHGAIAYKLGQIASDMLSAEMMFWNTLERLDHPEVYGPPWDHKQLVTASVMDNVATEYAWKVLNRCVELMGSYGYSTEGKMEKLLRDAKISQIVVGGDVLRTLEAARYYFGTQAV
jgi:alkylation response protein AidB-like acyl-CoA dehydrogenase